jgi:GNAT superfamily N-acetyltransferase
MVINPIESDEAIAGCYPVLVQLRPHLRAEDFVARIRQQMQEGYRLVGLRVDGRVQAVAGFRVLNTLSVGRQLYVDDLVTAEASRSRGYGAALLGWLVERAREQGCEQLQLDSGVQRCRAHRFYFAQGLHIVYYHFAMDLRSESDSSAN